MSATPDLKVELINTPARAIGPEYWVKVEDVQLYLAGRLSLDNLRNRFKTRKTLVDEVHYGLGLANQARIHE